jgi:CTP-dependent riboflavin kinase
LIFFVFVISIQSPLSPSLPPSSTINTNKNYNELLLKPFLQRNNNETNSSDVIEIDSDLEYSPRISLNRIIHVKDEDEILNDNDQKKVTINMAEATKQMLNHEYPQPVILLKRICLEK